MTRRVRRPLSIAGFAVLLSVAGTLVGQQPAVRPQPPAPGPLPVATLNNGATVVTGEEFAKFLMDRGGADRLETYVNIRIIEAEAAKRGVTVTKLEMEAALAEDLAGMEGMKKADFIRIMLPRYGKTFYEWMEDGVRPRLLLTKMCRDRVKVKEEDLQIEYERRYGEKRRCQMLIWPLGDDKREIAKRYANARKDQTGFDNEARGLVSDTLARSLGHMKPISRHLIGEDPQVEKAAFAMKEGQVSEVMETKQGFIVIKLHEIIAPQTNVKYEEVKEGFRSAAFNELVTKEIPKFFAELKAASNPQIKYVPPTEWRTTGNFLDGLPNILPAGHVPAPGNKPGSSTPTPTPSTLPAAPK